LHQYEFVKLVDLAPDTVEEAVALIPSLGKKDKDVESLLKDMLDEMEQFRSAQ